MDHDLPQGRGKAGPSLYMILTIWRREKTSFVLSHKVQTILRRLDRRFPVAQSPSSHGKVLHCLQANLPAAPSGSEQSSSPGKDPAAAPSRAPNAPPSVFFAKRGACKKSKPNPTQRNRPPHPAKPRLALRGCGLSHAFQHVTRPPRCLLGGVG
jgi:hypothetical protein